MVAENTNAPTKPAKIRKQRTNSLPIPLGLRLKARNLYLIQGLPHSETGAQLGLTPEQVSQMAFRYGWTKLKAKRLAQIEKRADARTEGQIDEINDAIASECEVIALQGLARAKSEAESKGKFAARNFQSWTGGVSNLVKVQRAARGLDARNDGSSGEGAAINLSFFLGIRDANTREEVSVAPIDVAASAAAGDGPKQLTQSERSQ